MEEKKKKEKETRQLHNFKKMEVTVAHPFFSQTVLVLSGVFQERVERQAEAPFSLAEGEAWRDVAVSFGLEEPHNPTQIFELRIVALNINIHIVDSPLPINACMEEKRQYIASRLFRAGAISPLMMVDIEVQKLVMAWRCSGVQ